MCRLGRPQTSTTAHGYAPWELGLGKSSGGLQNHARNNIYSFNNCRAVKSSFKELINLPAFETVSKNWKKNILTEIKFIWKGDKGEDKELCGVAMDPVLFIEQYMARFLKRRELEGSLPEPGHYEAVFKVSLNLK